MITCRVLGPVELALEGGPAPAELLWRKNLALLVYLARSPTRARTRDHLIGLLWGEKPESAARHSLNEAIRVLRKYVGADGLESEGDQVRLAPGAVELDADRFESLVAEQDWRGAAELVAGEFMEGFGVPGCSQFEDWLYTQRVGLRQQSMEALANRARQLLDGGQIREAAVLGQRALALEPTSELAAATAMRSLAVGGDRAGALEIFDTFAARLAHELGIEPDVEIQALAERVRLERTWRLPQHLAAARERGGESRRTPLLEREEELAKLLGVWTACRDAGRATLAVIEGDPGTGKTRLAEEMVARARLDGAIVATTRAVEADVTAPWSGVLAVARGTPPDCPGLEAASKAALAAFAAELPEWAERFGLEPGDAGALPLARALTEVLRSLSAEQPMLVLVDDAHWLDRDSLLALGALLRDLEQAPLFFLLTAAPHAEPAELTELRARLGRELTGVVVRLSPLSVVAVRALARWALPTYSEVDLDRVARRVGTDSAGFPLLAVELLHAVALGLDLATTGGAWPAPFQTLDQTLPGDLPDAVVAAVRVGFRRLTSEGQAALAAAAVLGERVDASALQRATGLDPDSLAAALDELEWGRWLTAESRGYSFVARIVRDVVARDMVTAGQRKRILETAAGA